MYASGRGNLELVEYLLQNGANVNHGVIGLKRNYSLHH
jgi:hypothetical protein